MAALIQEFYDTVNLILNDRIVRNIAVFITVLCLFLPLYTR